MGNSTTINLDSIARQTQITVAALSSGVLFFLIIVMVFLGARVQPFDPGAIISIVMGILAIALIVARFVLPGFMVNANRQSIARGTWRAPAPASNRPVPQSDEEKLLAIFLTKTIIGSALLEGGAFANLVAFLLEGQTYSLIFAVVLLLGILVGYPTRNGVAEWLDTQQRRLKEQRDLGG